MARDTEGLPPPIKGGRTEPEMRSGGRRGSYDQLSRLAELGGGAETGGEEQAAQLVMSAAQQLMQAAQLFPPIQEMVGRALAVVKSGVDEMSGGAGGMGEMGMGEEQPPQPKPKKKKRVRPPSGEDEGAGDEEMMGGY